MSRASVNDTGPDREIDALVPVASNYDLPNISIGL